MSFNFKKILYSPVFKVVFSVFSVIGVLASIYGGYKLINPSRHHLSCNIISNIKAFEINQEINRLSIYVDSINLSKSSKTIRICTVRISNDGNDNLFPESYVSDFELFIENAVLLEAPQIVGSSNNYIQREISSKLFLKDSATVILPPVALDVDDYYTLQLLILHPEETTPIIGTNGKIVGQQDIPVNVHDIKLNKGGLNVLYRVLLTILSLLIIVMSFIMIKFQQRVVSQYEKIIQMQREEYKRMMIKQVIASRKNEKK